MKIWQVRPGVGRIALEKQGSRIVLSNDLPQELLAELAKEKLAAGFLEQVSVPITESTDVESES
ncbi:hypothetical protein [Arundinibacter roseus]|uniref:Uncharacterized protein n=1 Tax=Arundinibacter roseus TaxID=2070510 RepID=A0A4R4K9J4_9BACT|nr:hypothetical protein [Arundinibacter roseus]TDB64398.1 hypothetical protein EZE20_11995 [Arundinibacter roseus]